MFVIVVTDEEMNHVSDSIASKIDLIGSDREVSIDS